MGCSICNRSACVPSFHSIEEQEAHELRAKAAELGLSSTGGRPLKAWSKEHPEARYIGDGVYASVDGRGTVTCITTDGISVTNEIVFEREVMTNLERFVGGE